ncbi:MULTISPECIES: Mrp/NBP35 family ATP-binding protein [Faecalicoccus]|uniref:Mrp/NBP35 family ATP-binding protein n=1 Tax=Faecalicoccus TaxID=1573536 RepID=UPI0022E703AD|nr:MULTISPECIES: Mrp/NBP35 family ATP-binding protein [Faecalicoccus]MDB7987879.1 Mrp/NBP35 family ATP-binding protein [Faecalicoccus pleomorphus]MDB7992538.1 Mrp/NBP35 family ATP-binding protein [Faecalicoccus pleomorphus]MDY4278384.1 Mrp/NBP35 family ATP-binding protein [Faecalicoccus sp.]
MSCEGCPSKGNCGKDQSTCGVENNPNNHIKNIVAIMSGKGGVGKSTITVMVAKALAKKGYKVGIMDADITGPSIPRLFAAENEQAYATKENYIIPVEVADGIKIMSLNFLMKNESDPVIWRGPVIAGVVKQFYTDVLWGDLDVLLIDMPPGTGDVALTIMQSLPVSGVLMVSTPQPMVSMIVAKAIHMCEQMHVPVYGVIENMAYLECPNCQEKIEFYDTAQLHQFFEDTKTKLYGTLPMLDLIRDLNTYAQYNENQKEIVHDLIDSAVDQLIQDIGC